jgi:hypothetical protein
MQNLIFPPALPGCSACNDKQVPVALVDAKYYGVNGWDYRSLLTLRGKVPTDTPIDCATQAAFNLGPANLVSL